MATAKEDVFDDSNNVDIVHSDQDEGGETGSEVEYEEEEVEEDEEEAPVTPSKKSKRHSGTPGKVNPSEEVRNMQLSSPAAVAKSNKNQLSPTKNPFPTFGAWDKDTLSSIEIVVPVFTSKDETTNKLTMQSKPEARYWRGPITFNYGNYTSSTIRFDNVPIPYHTAQGYGASFIYLCLPGFAADIFAEACKTRRPTRVVEASLKPDANRWWKVANKVEESVGIINKATGKFHKKSLETIFDATNAGITANVTLSFQFKASTDDREQLKPTTAGRVSIVLERAIINTTDVNVQGPVRISRNKQKAEPTATSRDVADDKLMERLRAIGL